MNPSEVCYALPKEHWQDGKRTRSYALETDGREIGELTCGPEEADKGVPFELRLDDGQGLAWTAMMEPGCREYRCRIDCPDLDWNFLLMIPHAAEHTIIELGGEEFSLRLLKRKTIVGCGTDCFRLITSEGVEDYWFVVFETGMIGAIDTMFRLMTLGLLPKKNENWITGAKVASRLDERSQQKLVVLNATFRTLVLDNDFRHD